MMDATDKFVAKQVRCAVFVVSLCPVILLEIFLGRKGLIVPPPVAPRDSPPRNNNWTRKITFRGGKITFKSKLPVYTVSVTWYYFFIPNPALCTVEDVYSSKDEMFRKKNEMP